MEQSPQRDPSTSTIEGPAFLINQLSSLPLLYFLGGIGFAIASMINSNFRFSGPATVAFGIIAAGLFIAGPLCRVANAMDQKTSKRESPNP